VLFLRFNQIRFKVSFQAHVQKFDYALGYHYFVVPEEEALKFDGGKWPVRVVCTINGLFSWQGALQRANGGFHILLAQTNLRKLGLRIGSAFEAELAPDNSEFGLPMPEAMQELLQQDANLNTLWEGFGISMKRNTLYYVNGTKNPDLQIKRAMQMIQKYAHESKSKEEE